MPKLTTLRFPRHLMGMWAAERALAGPRVAGESHRIIKVECELVSRDSVAPRRVRDETPKRAAARRPADAAVSGKAPKRAKSRV